ncbi:MAG: hypothetical protein JW885_11290 [Deltaproteobacteria bacterium]|nr:hypothetical protein [Candidatus Zymogenaceae bacterium]
MRLLQRTAILAVLCTAILLFSCGGRDLNAPPAPSGESGDATGFFTDVYDALDTLAEKTGDVKTEWKKKSGVKRYEWRLSEEAVDRYYRPLTKTDYYYYEDTDENVSSADPLMRIFLDEWDEYRSLSNTMDATKEITPELSDDIEAFTISAAALLAETPPIHRDMVRRIIGLRYRTLLLRAGVNPDERP